MLMLILHFQILKLNYDDILQIMRPRSLINLHFSVSDPHAFALREASWISIRKEEADPDPGKK